MATIYAIWALGLLLLSGDESFSKHETSLGVVLLTYYAAGTVGGALVGGMLPLARTLPGRVVLGLLAAFIVFFCVVTAVEGPFWRWGQFEWVRVAIPTFFFGTVCSVLWRRVTGL